MNDTEIVNLYWARSEAAIEASAQKYGSYCGGIARSILQNGQDVQESLNDTWLAAWNSIPPHRPAMLRTYLGKLTRRISLKKWRDGHALKRGGGEVQLALDELAECIPCPSSIDDALDEKALAALLNRFVAALPTVERRVFLCRYWHLEGVKEIAKRFGFSQSKVKSMLHRSRQKLMQLLMEEGVF